MFSMYLVCFDACVRVGVGRVSVVDVRVSVRVRVVSERLLGVINIILAQVVVVVELERPAVHLLLDIGRQLRQPFHPPVFCRFSHN